MAFKDFLKPHRSWEDGVGLLLGLTIGLTPWLYDENPVPRVAVNSAVTGLAVLMFAQLKMLSDAGGKSSLSWRVGSGSSFLHFSLTTADQHRLTIFASGPKFL